MTAGAFPGLPIIPLGPAPTTAQFDALDARIIERLGALTAEEANDLEDVVRLQQIPLVFPDDVALTSDLNQADSRGPQSSPTPKPSNANSTTKSNSDCGKPWPSKHFPLFYGSCLPGENPGTVSGLPPNRIGGRRIVPNDGQVVFRVVFGTDAQNPIVLDPGPLQYQPSPGRGTQLAADSRQMLLALLAYVDHAQGTTDLAAWGTSAFAHLWQWSGFNVYESNAWRIPGRSLNATEYLRVWALRLGVAAAVEALGDYPWHISFLSALDFHELYDPRVAQLSGPGAQVFFDEALGGVETVRPQTTDAMLRYGVLAGSGAEGVAAQVLTNPQSQATETVAGTSAQWFWWNGVAGMTTGAVWDTNPQVAADHARAAFKALEALSKAGFATERIEPQVNAADWLAPLHAAGLRAVTSYLVALAMQHRLEGTSGDTAEGYPSTVPAAATSGARSLAGTLAGFGTAANDRMTSAQVVLSLLRAMNVPVRLARMPYVNHETRVGALAETGACNGGGQGVTHPGMIIRTISVKNIASGWTVVAPTVGRAMTVAGIFQKNYGTPYIQDSLAIWFGLDNVRMAQQLIGQLTSWNLWAPNSNFAANLLRLNLAEQSTITFKQELVQSFCAASLKRWPVVAAQVKKGWSGWAMGSGGKPGAKATLGSANASPTAKRLVVRGFFEMGVQRVYSGKLLNNVALVPNDLYVATADALQNV